MGQMWYTLGGMVAGSVLTIALTTSWFCPYITKVDDEEEKEETSRAVEVRGGFNLFSPAASHRSDQVNFLSDLLARLWPYINVAGAEMVRETMEPMFADMMPGPMKSTKFTKIDLGTVPLKLDNIVVHEEKGGAVQFDMDVIWDSNCDIQLKAASLGMKFGVKTMSLKGRMTFLLRPLTSELPCFSAIQYAFINPPELELDFTGLLNVADFSVIDKTIRKIIQDSLKSMLVLPYRMLYKMDLAADFIKAYRPPVGIARICVQEGRGFVVEKSNFGKGDIPDAYCLVSVGCEARQTTKVIKDCLEPVWNETMDFLLCDQDQIIDLEVWDEDTGSFDADDLLGENKTTVGEVLLAGRTKEIELLLKKKPCGAYVSLGCDICKFTNNLDSLKNKNGTICGLVTMVVTSAFDLPVKKEAASSFCKIKYGGKEFVTGVVVDYPGYDCLNPIYDMGFHVPLMVGQSHETSVVLELWNGTKVMASTEVKFADLVAATDHIVHEKRKLKNGASLEFAITLYGVDELTDADAKAVSPRSSARSTTSAIGGGGSESVRVSLLRGHGFLIQKKSGPFRKDDVPDVYCNIKYGSSPQVWRTKTIKNDVAPSWKGESQDYTMLNTNQVVSLDCYDENRRGDDDYLGSARITVGKILLSGGSVELELEQKNGKKTGAYLVVRADMV